ncbi:MAG: hypothetical protein J7K40_02860 [candidate division Zixibacteria bacterium]|nr:hypothetical protein [candidate division Zixibacteria bacterium]
MKKIRLCIGSNDGKNIAKTHMGDTEYFYIYDIFENSDHLFVEKRVNAAKNMEHAKTEKMKEIIEIIKDSDILIARRKSPNFKNIANKTKYQPIVVKAEKISDILMILYNSFREIYKYITRRRNGELFDTILEL